MSRSFQAEIVENRALVNDLHILKVRPLVPVMYAEPGQFYMVQTGLSLDPLLKRPFCVFDMNSDEIDFLIRIRGRGTRLLAGMGKGDVLSLVGPLGRPYPASEKDPLIVVGGIGIASLFPLIKRLSHRAIVLYGARTKAELVFEDKIRVSAKDVCIATDDGSAGRKSTVVDCLPEYLDRLRTPAVYSCGPRPMLKRVAELCLSRAIECYISLEENMACGIGSCLGCTIKTQDGYRRVCTEGPVFSAQDVVWEERQ